MCQEVSKCLDPESPSSHRGVILCRGFSFPFHPEGPRSPCGLRSPVRKSSWVLLCHSWPPPRPPSSVRVSLAPQRLPPPPPPPLAQSQGLRLSFCLCLYSLVLLMEAPATSNAQDTLNGEFEYPKISDCSSFFAACNFVVV